MVETLSVTTKENDDILGVALPTKDMFDTLNSHFEGIHSLTSKAQPEELYNVKK